MSASNKWIIVVWNSGTKQGSCEMDLRDVYIEVIRGPDEENALSNYIDEIDENDMFAILRLIGLNENYSHNDDDINKNDKWLHDNMPMPNIDNDEIVCIQFIKDNKKRFIKFLSNLSFRICQIREC